MNANEHAAAHLNAQLQQLEAARELLSVTKRNLQLVDEHVALLQQESPGVVLADDVPTEHRVGWLGAVDDVDGANGIAWARAGVRSTVGWGNPKQGSIRNHSDAAFVVTDIFVAQTKGIAGITAPGGNFVEGFDTKSNPRAQLFLKLTDLNTGRAIMTGLTQSPLDLDRGAIPFSYLSAARPGLGPNLKNRLFAEWTIPRDAVVRAEVYNISVSVAGNSFTVDSRAFVTLFGYKVFGG